MEQYYPGYLFCDRCGMWCNDVVFLTDGQNDCNGDCKSCEHESNPREDK